MVAVHSAAHDQLADALGTARGEQVPQPILRKLLAYKHADTLMLWGSPVEFSVTKNGRSSMSRSQPLPSKVLWRGRLSADTPPNAAEDSIIHSVNAFPRLQHTINHIIDTINLLELKIYAPDQSSITQAAMRNKSSGPSVERKVDLSGDLELKAGSFRSKKTLSLI